MPYTRRMLPMALSHVNNVKLSLNKHRWLMCRLSEYYVGGRSLLHGYWDKRMDVKA